MSIRMEYDPLSCGCRVSFVIRDEDWAATRSLKLFEYEEETPSTKGDGKRYAEQSPHNMNLLADMVRTIGKRHDQNL